MTKIQEQNFTLKTFQLRAARMVAGIELKTIGRYLGLTTAAISLWQQKDNFAPLTTSKENILIIKKIFAEQNIFFPDEHSIALTDTMKEHKHESLTRFQLRAARTALGISQEQLAKYLNISIDIISRAELLENLEYIRPLDKSLPRTLKSWFENRNIIFKNDLSILFFEGKKIS